MNNDITVTFADINDEVIRAYSQKFLGYDNITCRISNILEVGEGSIVSPSNQKGIMDGGVELLFREHFSGVEDKIQRYIREDYVGKFPFGHAQIVPTESQSHPYLIFTPIVERPGIQANPCDVYHSLRAVFSQTSKFNKKVDDNRKIENLLIPGIGTGYGGLTPQKSAQILYSAYKNSL